MTRVADADMDAEIERASARSRSVGEPYFHRGRSALLAKTFALVFITVFLAEVGDKTQLATMLFASKQDASKWLVFIASSTALVLAAGIGVIVGSQLDRFVSPQTLKFVAGVGFIVIGAWTLLAK